MPNHVTHRVTVSGSPEEVQRFRDTCIVQGVEKNYKGEDEPFTNFDFNTLIPMPEIVKGVTEGSVTDQGLAVLGINIPSRGSFLRNDLESMLRYPWVEKAGITNANDLKVYLIEMHPDCISQGIAAYKAYRETGFKSWYDWSIANWGTKWDAYSFEEISASDGHYAFTFNTAWSTPEPIWDALAERFPTLTFSVVGFDEGWGFAVEGEIVDGENGVEGVPADDELYQAVYGEAPEHFTDDEDEDENAA